MANSTPLTGTGRPPFEGAYAAAVWPMSARTIGLASGIGKGARDAAAASGRALGRSTDALGDGPARGPGSSAGQKKNPRHSRDGGFFVRTLAVTYSRMAAATLSSARSVFTSEFEMGSGGSRSL